MSYLRSSRNTWETSHELEDECFDFEGRTYHVKASINILWLDDSDYDREYGYGTCITPDKVDVTDWSIEEIHPESGDTIKANVTDKDVVKAVLEWADEQANEQDCRN